MIQSLSSGTNLLSASQLIQTNQTEKSGEVEHDGDSDDGASGVKAAVAGARNLLPDYMGKKVNMLA